MVARENSRGELEPSWTIVGGDDGERLKSENRAWGERLNSLARICGCSQLPHCMKLARLTDHRSPCQIDTVSSDCFSKCQL